MESEKLNQIKFQKNTKFQMKKRKLLCLKVVNGQPTKTE